MSEAARALPAASEMLGASLEVRDVAELRARLLASLDVSDCLRVDVSRVLSADTAGAQLLLALQHEAARRGRTVDFIGESVALARLSKLLGVDFRSTAGPHPAPGGGA